jgi:hypothetical protein
MDIMIEMKDLQDGGTLEDDCYDDEGLVGGMEMQSGKKNLFLPVHHSTPTSVENGDVDDCQPDRPAGTGVLMLLRRRLERKPTRWLVILMGTFLLAAIVYVVGTVYMSDDSIDGLVQPFDRESGFVENGAENEKEQESIDNAAHRNQDHYSNAHWGGQQNPFASKVNQPQQHYHQQGDSVHVGSGHLGHDGHIGNKRPGKFGHHQGTNSDTNGSSSSSGVSVRKNDTSSNGATPPPPPDASHIDEKDVYCEDLSRYQSWYDAIVTKESGPQFRVVKQYDHDRKAFTYVDVKYAVRCHSLFARFFSQVISLFFSNHCFYVSVKD